MSSFTASPTQNCARCARPLVPGALECPQCHTLVHEHQVEQFAAHARALEAHGDFSQARERWLACLPLLPPQSKQAAWIRDHVRELETSAATPVSNQPASAAKPKWAKWLGPLAPIALFIAKFKAFFLAILKFKFLFSFAAFIGLYWAMWGPKFGIGFAVLILIHEMGHFIDVKRRGLPADMPVFLPGLGAYVRWKALNVSLETRAAVSLAGPFAGLLSSAACWLIWRQTGNGIWAALAATGAWLNIINLTPIWILDGGSAAYALSKIQRGTILVISAVLGYALRDVVFWIVSAGLAWRLFTRDEPEEPSNFITAYFVAVLVGLAIVVWQIPNLSGPR
ncbi:MAG TPA: site-2 protease family protein [Candidatus Angelobacter sp.]|nr:site-2 protease family protein [Candidatus Angelobacter sp.]